MDIGDVALSNLPSDDLLQSIQQTPATPDIIVNPGLAGNVIKIETPDTPPHTPPRDSNIISPLMTAATTTVGSMGHRVTTTSSGIKVVLQPSTSVTGQKVTTVNPVTKVLNTKIKIHPKPAVTTETNKTTAAPTKTSTTPSIRE